MRSYHHRFRAFMTDVIERSPFIRVVAALVVLWLGFSVAMWMVERGAQESPLDSLGAALYWAVAAFSTAGIASEPATGLGRLVGALWIVIGSVLFFGAIIATITGYFLRPLQRPVRNLIDTIENNLEHLEDLSVDELELLRETADGLIEHMERLKAKSRGTTPET
ncbi:MAG: two pore domain potassium channel family protein [Wenzhouxiangella sp.]